MSVSRPPTVPAHEDLVEVFHAGAVDAPAPLIISIDRGGETVAFGTCPVPATVNHPADALVGFVAPPEWDAIGLITDGWAHDLADVDHRAGAGRSTGADGPHVGRSAIGSFAATTGSRRIRATVVLDRCDHSMSVLDLPDGDRQVLSDRPAGWAADVLARALRLPTPPPAKSLAAWVEAVWLDRIAAVVLSRPGEVRSWRRLAHLHPLSPSGPALPGALLAVETQALDLQSSWTRMRQLWSSGPSADDDEATEPLERAPLAPGGTMMALPEWFDDGSFSRWVQRNLPPADVVLPAVLDAVPVDSGAELIDGLVSVAPPVGAP
jgi:hypothetical protein